MKLLWSLPFFATVCFIFSFLRTSVGLPTPKISKRALVGPTDVTGECCYSISSIVAVGYTTITIGAFAPSSYCRQRGQRRASL